MKLPKRVAQHISESASFKLFSSKVPNNWIIREVSERDYGIDCYLELVKDNNELTGHLASIQLKSRQSIPWTQKDTYKLTGIDISTSNYWFKFQVPVFIFLVDINEQEVYFESVNYHIKRNFFEYRKQSSFSYKFRKSQIFKEKKGAFSFKFSYYYEYYRSRFESELLYFLSNLENMKSFQFEHDNRDFHMPVEGPDLIFFEAMHRNFSFLCHYLNIDTSLSDLKTIKEKSREKFKDDNGYELYEDDLIENMEEFKELNKEIIRTLKSFLHGEQAYWEVVDPTVFDYVNHLDDDGNYRGC